ISRRRLLALGIVGVGSRLSPCSFAEAGSDRAVAQPTSKKGIYPGRIFVSALGNEEVERVLAVDPNDLTWLKLSATASNSTRISPDGKRMICPPGPSAEKPTLWLSDV